MSCNFPKERLIAYIYDELDQGDKQATDEHLAACAICQKELAELTGARSILQMAPAEEADPAFEFTTPALRLAKLPAKDRWRGWRKPAFGIAAVIAGFLILASLSNLNLSYEAGKVTLQFDLLPTAGKPMQRRSEETIAVSRRELATWQKHQAEAVQALMREFESRLRRENGVTFTRLAHDLEARRRDDLRKVGLGLEAFQLTNRRELQKANNTLRRLVQISQAVPGQALPEPTLEHEKQEH